MNHDEKWNYREKLFSDINKERVERAKYFKDLNDGVMQGPLVQDEVNDMLWKETLSKQLFSDYLKEGKVEVEVLNTGYSSSAFVDNKSNICYDCMQYELLKIRDVFDVNISFKQEFYIGTANAIDGKPPKEKPISIEPHYVLNNLLMFYRIHEQLEKGADIESINRIIEGKNISIEATLKKRNHI